MQNFPIDILLNKKDTISSEELLTHLKDLYTRESEKSINDLDKNIFFWNANHVTIYFIDDTKSGVAFATNKPNQDKDNIKLIDLRKETDTLEFNKMFSFDKKLAYFKHYNLFQLNSEEKIILASTKSIPMGIDDFITSWVAKEYEVANHSLSLPALDLSFIDENTIHQSKFQFREMLSNIDDDQFKAEFSEFLFGYNNEKFFLAASAMGSIIEHLLFIILQNYGDERLIGSRRPTADKYLKAMERQQHFNFTDRDSTFIDNIFQTRNSISHYNSGYVLKSQCDMMLMGLNSIYRRFYLPSKAYSISHK